MKIKRLEIVNFGKFSNFTLNLADGFQVIFGNNEDGKSTIMSFVLLMLYSDHGRSRSLEQMTRQLYLPWNGSPMEGSIELSDKGTNYRLQKLFGETAGKDKITLLNLDSGKEVKLPTGVEVGKHFLGLDLASFKRSCFVKQLGSIEPGKDTDDVAEKLLINLVGDREEDFAHQDVISRLESAKLKLVSKSGNKGILAEALTNLQSLKEEREQVRQLLLSQEQLQEEYSGLKERLDQQNNISQKIKDIRVLEQSRKLEALLELQNSAQALEKELTNEALSFGDLEPFFIKGNQLLVSHNQKKETIRSLGDDDPGSVFISSAERERFDQLSEKIKSVRSLIERYDSFVLPATEKADQLEGQLEDSQNNRSELELTLNNLEPQKNLKERLELELQDTSARFSAKQTLLAQKEEHWNREKELQARELESYKTKVEILEQNTKKRPNLLFLTLGLLLIIAGAATGFLIDYLLFLVCSLGLIFVITSLIKSVKKENPLLSETKAALETASESLFSWEQQTLSEITDLKADFILSQKKLEDTENQLTQLEYSFDPQLYFQASARLEQLSQEIIRLDLEHSAAKDNAKNLELQLASEADELGISLTDQPLSQLNESFAVLDGQLKDLMIAKEVVNSSEFKEKFLSSQSKEKNLASAKILEQELLQLENEFVALLSTLHQQPDFTTATGSYSKLIKQYQTLVEYKKESSFTAGAMGISDRSTANLKKLLEAASSIPQDLDPSHLEELVLTHAKLKEENLLGKMEEMQKMIRPPARNLEQIGLEISELVEQVNETKLYYDGLSIALKKMEQADEEMRQSFGPILNQKTGQIFSKLTQEKYSDVLVNKDYDIQFKSGAHFHQWQYLSNGTTDQAYLALRLAMSELLASEGESVPLFLDDVLVQYDDQRTQSALEFLSQYSKEKQTQMILFTCHGRVLSYATQLDINSSNIGDIAN